MKKESKVSPMVMVGPIYHVDGSLSYIMVPPTKESKSSLNIDLLTSTQHGTTHHLPFVVISGDTGATKAQGLYDTLRQGLIIPKPITTTNITSRELAPGCSLQLCLKSEVIDLARFDLFELAGKTPKKHIFDPHRMAFAVINFDQTACKIDLSVMKHARTLAEDPKMLEMHIKEIFNSAKDIPTFVLKSGMIRTDDKTSIVKHDLTFADLSSCEQTRQYLVAKDVEVPCIFLGGNLMVSPEYMLEQRCADTEQFFRDNYASVVTSRVKPPEETGKPKKENFTSTGPIPGKATVILEDNCDGCPYKQAVQSNGGAYRPFEGEASKPDSNTKIFKAFSPLELHLDDFIFNPRDGELRFVSIADALSITTGLSYVADLCARDQFALGVASRRPNPFGMFCERPLGPAQIPPAHYQPRPMQHQTLAYGHGEIVNNIPPDSLVITRSDFTIEVIDMSFCKHDPALQGTYREFVYSTVMERIASKRKSADMFPWEGQPTPKPAPTIYRQFRLFDEYTISGKDVTLVRVNLNELKSITYKDGALRLGNDMIILEEVHIPKEHRTMLADGLDTAIRLSKLILNPKGYTRYSGFVRGDEVNLPLGECTSILSRDRNNLKSVYRI